MPMMKLNTASSLEKSAQQLVDKMLSGEEESRVIPVVYEGHLLLLGQVRSKEKKEDLVRSLEELPGLKTLHDELEIGVAPLGFSERSKDTWITAQVKAALLAHEQVAAFKIKVITENHVVYLLGSVPKEKQKAALELSKNIEGVSHVIGIFDSESESETLSQ